MRHGSAWIRDGTETDLTNAIGVVGWAKSMSAKLTNYPTPVTSFSKTCCLSTSSVFPSHRGWRRMSDLTLGVSTLAPFPEMCGNDYEPSVSWMSDTRGTHKQFNLALVNLSHSRNTVFSLITIIFPSCTQLVPLFCPYIHCGADYRSIWWTGCPSDTSRFWNRTKRNTSITEEKYGPIVIKSKNRFCRLKITRVVFRLNIKPRDRGMLAQLCSMQRQHHHLSPGCHPYFLPLWALFGIFLAPLRCEGYICPPS